MKIWRIVKAATIATGVCGALVAHAESTSPPSTSAAAPPASAIASAPAPGPAPAPAPGDAPTLASDVPGVDRSKAPAAAEWASARPVKVTRQGPRAASCSTIRVREWLRVRCSARTFAISLVGGSNDGLSFWIGGEAEGQFGEVQFPLRRGDRRVVQLWASETDAAGARVEPGVVLQELWPEGDAAPTVTIL